MAGVVTGAMTEKPCSNQSLVPSKSKWTYLVLVVTQGHVDV